MGIVFPSAAISRRWNGALQARLTRAPLELFLRSQGLVPARTGVAQDTDDVTRGTLHLMETALALVSSEPVGSLVVSKYETVGRLACITSRSLAGVIAKPDVWRIAALLSTARLLSPWIGVTGAALTSASCVRQFEKETSAVSAADEQLAQAAGNAVKTNSPFALAQTSALIATCLRLAPTIPAHLRAAEVKVLAR